MKKRRAEAIDIATKILRLVAQSLRRDIVWRSPNLGLYFGYLCGGACQAEIAYLRDVFVNEQNVGWFNIAMDETLPTRRTQPFGDLNAGLKHLLFRQSSSLLYEIVEASMINQLHHDVKLTMIGSG